MLCNSSHKLFTVVNYTVLCSQRDMESVNGDHIVILKSHCLQLG